MNVRRGVAVALALGALAFVGLLAGFGSDALTDEPEAQSLYAVDAGSGTARFVVSQVVFGDEGYVEIRNVGDAAGSLDGLWLCQRPSYFPLTGMLEADETVWVFAGGEDASRELSGGAVAALFTNGRIGSLAPADGEVGLYASSDFGDASSILSYVEWGSSGHGRSSVAITAGIWGDGDAAPGGGSGVMATVPVPTSAADWQSG